MAGFLIQGYMPDMTLYAPPVRDPQKKKPRSPEVNLGLGLAGEACRLWGLQAEGPVNRLFIIYGQR